MDKKLYANSWSGSTERDRDKRVLNVGTLRRIVMRVAKFLLRRGRHRPVEYGEKEFSVPQLLGRASLPRSPGLYALHVRHWWFGLQPIAFGAAHNLHEELMVDGHEGFVQWLMHRGSKRGVYVSFHTAPELDHADRHRASLQLTRHHFPQRTHSVDEHLAYHRIHRTLRPGGSRHSTEH